MPEIVEPPTQVPMIFTVSWPLTLPKTNPSMTITATRAAAIARNKMPTAMMSDVSKEKFLRDLLVCESAGVAAGKSPGLGPLCSSLKVNAAGADRQPPSESAGA